MSAANQDTSSSILVIYTGGTIGMRDSDRGLVAAGDFDSRMTAALASLPPDRRRRLPEYVVWESPDPIDSSSATPDDWAVLAALIADRYQDYAGFVVLHGTDTLVWCASSLAFQLQGLSKPVIVTGAQKPLESEGSDALFNLEAALAFAAQTALREVCVSFGGRLLRGCRARKWYTADALGFESPNWPLLGEMVDHSPIVYTPRCWPARGAPRFELAGDDAAVVIRLVLWPGIRAKDVARWLDDHSLRGVVIECWGSGNLPEDEALLGVLARACAEGKVMVAVSQCPVGGVSPGTYASGQTLNEIGILSGDDMTPEAAHSKLAHLLAQDLSRGDLRQRLLTSLVGESGAFTA
ncbi:L-asparaginase 1 [Salinicola sp. MH3R3-1]|uniref:asparaginase n=1 Tax=Salinicola sp. MH3R3-1 TaxID=1928762 RepID=UPI00094E65DA|nr:asparaginase [Salinicola sp. MH3R3-1]OLO08259.1 L-asparaginase 1 [Salinicola sp. MH3R3-1]